VTALEPLLALEPPLVCTASGDTVLGAGCGDTAAGDGAGSGAGSGFGVRCVDGGVKGSGLGCALAALAESTRHAAASDPPSARRLIQAARRPSGVPIRPPYRRF
jgi:hypothetical protein